MSNFLSTDQRKRKMLSSLMFLSKMWPIWVKLAHQFKLLTVESLQFCDHSSTNLLVFWYPQSSQSSIASQRRIIYVHDSSVNRTAADIHLQVQHYLGNCFQSSIASQTDNTQFIDFQFFLKPYTHTHEFGFGFNSDLVCSKIALY